MSNQSNTDETTSSKLVIEDLSPNAEEIVEEKVLPSVIGELKAGIPFKFERGQYWANGDQYVALVLEINEFAVIYQALMNIDGAGNGVFDFVAGQELSTLEGFRKFLEQRGGKLVHIPEELIAQALRVYQGMLANGKIFRTQRLPRSVDAAMELREHERFRQEKRIVPPPPRDRKKRALHWLTAGASGDNMVCKLWDPEKENWVLPDGSLDPQSTIGFINGYHSMAAMPFSEDTVESFSDFLNRFVALLRKHNFFFDEQWVRDRLGQWNPENLSVTEYNDSILGVDTPRCFRPNPTKEGDTELKMPMYGLNFFLGPVLAGVERDMLTIELSTNDRTVQMLTFYNVQNRQFIPNNDVKLSWIIDDRK